MSRPWMRASCNFLIKLRSESCGGSDRDILRLYGVGSDVKSNPDGARRMTKDPQNGQTLSTLNTKVEDEFISPLTAVRGALEILRDYPDLTAEERSGFVSRALEECRRLEAGIDHLAASVYAAARNGSGQDGKSSASEPRGRFSKRIRIASEPEVVELDLSEFEFSSTDLVNEFYNEVDAAISETGRKWYFVVNNTRCQVWPEAWVAFAHRGKKVRVNFSLGTVHYDVGSNGRNPEVAGSRGEALARIQAMGRKDRG